jgi:hypothetical protein
VQLEELLQPKRDQMVKDFLDKYPPEIQAAIAKPAAERTPYEWQMYYKAKPNYEFDDVTVGKALRGAAKAKYEHLKEQLTTYSSSHPGEFPVAVGMRDVSAMPPATHVLRGGSYENREAEVKPGFLTMLSPGTADVKPMPNSTGRRSALAAWLTTPDNPLPARVMVNRMWHWHFGQGIVATPSDFGIMGQRPTHPELLDWLANDFIQSGWDMKRMHKQIVTSATYRQSSVANDAGMKQDSRNRFLWRFPRQRLEGEAIRDAALAVSGALNAKLGGPSVMPELPAGMSAPRGGWTLSAPEDRNRRSLYVFIRRNSRYPMLEAFDMPDTHESCGRRNATITAPQALALLNGKVVLEWAQDFAGRVAREAGGDLSAQIDRAYELAYSRKPDASERDTIQTFFAKQKDIVARRGESADRAQAAALVDFCHMLLNSNEFIYRN